MKEPLLNVISDPKLVVLMVVLSQLIAIVRALV